MCRPFQSPSLLSCSSIFHLSVLSNLTQSSTILPITSPICWIEWHSITTLSGNMNSRHICTTLMCTWFLHPLGPSIFFIEHQAYLFLGVNQEILFRRIYCSPTSHPSLDASILYRIIVTLCRLY